MRAAIPGAYVHLVLNEAKAGTAVPRDAARLYTPIVGATLASGRDVTDAQYHAALEVAAAVRRSVDAALAPVDALVLPDAADRGAAAWRGRPRDRSGRPADAGARRDAQAHTTVQLLRTSGDLAPAARRTGLPVGLQLVGRRDDTARLLAIAAACEKIVSRA